MPKRDPALKRRYGIEFADYFANAPAWPEPLVADDLVRIDSGRITVTSRGRRLLRNIAVCFDHSLNQPMTDTGPRFARPI